jgi:hypothetical protein
MFRTERPDWYMQKIEKSKKHSWKISDFTQVYTLRVAPPADQKVPVGQVRKILGKKCTRKISKIDVYNLTRQSKAILSDRCMRCGNDLTDKDKRTKKTNRLLFLCTKCKEITTKLKEKRRKSFLKGGMCGVCGKRKTLPGRTSCVSCISMTYRRRNKKGLCGTCGANPIAKRSLCHCTACLEKMRVKQ